MACQNLKICHEKWHALELCESTNQNVDRECKPEHFLNVYMKHCLLHTLLSPHINPLLVVTRT